MLIEITVWKEKVTTSTEKTLLTLRMIWNISKKEWIINYSSIFLKLLKSYPTLINWTKNNDCTEEKKKIKEEMDTIVKDKGYSMLAFQ